MTHGRSFFHSEYLSPPSHPFPPPPSSAAAHGLLPSAASTPGVTGRPGSRGVGTSSPHAHTASSPPARCGAPGGSRCLPAPWGGRRGRLPGLDAFTWARRLWRLLPRRERAQGSCPRRPRRCRGARPGLEPAAQAEGARGSAGSRGGGGGGQTGHGSRRAAGRGRRLRLKSTRISKEAPKKYVTYSSKTLRALSCAIEAPLLPLFCRGSTVLKGLEFLPALLCAPTPVQ